MVSTQTYDLLVLVGVIVLIAVIIFWAVRYGAAVVSNVMLESPIALQNTFASYAAVAGMSDGNVTIEQTITKKYPFYAMLNASHIWIKPASKKYYPFTEVERGGYLGFGIKPASPFVNCVNIPRVYNVRFYVNLHNALVLNKTDNKMSIGVK